MMMKKLQFICVVIFLFIVACSGHKQVNSPDRMEIDQTNSPQQENDGLVPFILGVGDEVSISVWRNDDLKRTTKINPSGNILLPLAGTIKASGLTSCSNRRMNILAWSNSPGFTSVLKATYTLIPLAWARRVKAANSSNVKLGAAMRAENCFKPQ